MRVWQQRKKYLPINATEQLLQAFALSADGDCVRADGMPHLLQPAGEPARPAEKRCRAAGLAGGTVSALLLCKNRKGL